MIGPVFVDTNVIVYRYDAREETGLFAYTTGRPELGGTKTAIDSTGAASPSGAAWPMTRSIRIRGS